MSEGKSLAVYANVLQASLDSPAQCAKSLENLADYLRDEGAREQAPGPEEFFAPLYRIAKDGDCRNEDVLAQLLRVLGNYIIMDEERVDAFLRSDFVPEVLRVLSLDSSEKIQRLAASTIGNIYGVELKEHLTGNERVQAALGLATLLRSPSLGVRQAVLQATSNACELDPAFVQALLAADGQVVLLDLLNGEHSEDTDVTESATLLLSICQTEKDIALAIDLCYGLLVILATRERPSDVCEEVAETLYSLFELKECRAAFWDGEVLGVITDIVVDAIRDSSAAERAADEDGDNRAAVYNGCTEILRKIVIVDEGAHAAMKAGCLSRLAPLLPLAVENATTSTQLLNCLLMFLSNVIRNDDVCIAAMQLLDPTTLARLCKHSTTTTRQLALGLVRNLAMVQAHKDTMSLNGLLLAAVESILVDDLPTVLVAVSAARIMVKGYSDACGICLQFMVDKQIINSFQRYLPSDNERAGNLSLLRWSVGALDQSSTPAERAEHALRFEIARCLSELIINSPTEDVIPVVNSAELPLVAAFVYALVASEHEVMQREGLDAFAIIFQALQQSSSELVDTIRGSEDRERMLKLCDDLYSEDDTTHDVINKALR